MFRRRAIGEPEDDALTDDTVEPRSKTPRATSRTRATTKSAKSGEAAKIGQTAAPKKAAAKKAGSAKSTVTKAGGAKAPAKRAAPKTRAGKGAASKAPARKPARSAPPQASRDDPSAALRGLILDALGDGKAEDVVAIDLAGKTSVADAMVIASGRSNTQVAALADRVAKALKEAGRPTPAIEGLPQGDWVLIDAGDVVAHIFRPEVRAFYNLEKMWGGDRPSEPRS